MLSAFLFVRWLITGNQSELSQRLAEADKIEEPERLKIPLIVRNDQLSQIAFVNRWLQRLDVAQNLRRLIYQADLSITVGTLLLRMLVFAVVGLLLILKLDNPILSMSCFFFFGSLPLAHVLYLRRKRLKRFEEQFPDALDMMHSAVRAGFALHKALQVVANEAPDPIGIEFRKTFEEINLGVPLKDALENFIERIDSTDLKLFVTAVLIQKDSGGNLSEILIKICTTIRARFKLLGQIKVFTAQGRFSGLIIGSLPIGLGLIVSMFNPDYIMLLFNESLGHYFIAVGLTMQLIGFFVIRKIVRIKVN
jgi:tight adherence protein B